MNFKQQVLAKYEVVEVTKVDDVISHDKTQSTPKYLSSTSPSIP